MIDITERACHKIENSKSETAHNSDINLDYQIFLDFIFIS